MPFGLFLISASFSIAWLLFPRVSTYSLELLFPLGYHEETYSLEITVWVKEDRL